MLATPSLAATEKRVFRAYWQDGLLDLITGVVVILVGVGGLCDALVPLLALPIVGVFAWRFTRRSITEPRFGSVVFSTRRVHQLRHGLVAILSLGLVVGGNLVARLWLGRAHTPFAEWFAPAIPATILLAMSLSCALVLGLWRFVVYALLFGAAGLWVSAVRLEPWWALVAVGAAIALWGAVLLGIFLREFPKLSNEVEE